MDSEVESQDHQSSRDKKDGKLLFGVSAFHVAELNAQVAQTHGVGIPGPYLLSPIRKLGEEDLMNRGWRTALGGRPVFGHKHIYITEASGNNGRPAIAPYVLIKRPGKSVVTMSINESSVTIITVAQAAKL